MSRRLSFAELEAGLETLLAIPATNRLVGIYARPAKCERLALATAGLSVETGLEQDNWLTENWLFLENNQPDPRNQVSLMNSRVLRLIADDDERMRLAGNNLIVDFDLSEAAAPAGTRLQIGGVVLEISDVPHTGCRSFSNRFGFDATRFVNSPQGKALHLRGRYAQILKPGQVTVGDTVSRVSSSCEVAAMS